MWTPASGGGRSSPKRAASTMGTALALSFALPEPRQLLLVQRAVLGVAQFDGTLQFIGPIAHGANDVGEQVLRPAIGRRARQRGPRDVLDVPACAVHVSMQRDRRLGFSSARDDSEGHGG